MELCSLTVNGAQIFQMALGLLTNQEYNFQPQEGVNWLKALILSEQ